MNALGIFIICAFALIVAIGLCRLFMDGRRMRSRITAQEHQLRVEADEDTKTYDAGWPGPGELA